MPRCPRSCSPPSARKLLRRLTLPQELPFDATRWIEACTNVADRTDFGKMEDLFDVRSALYSALNRLQHRPEPDAGAEARWREVNGRAVAAIRANHPGAKVFYSAVYDANPNGLNNLEPLPTDCEPQAETFHFYEPHAFTHQKMKTRNARSGDSSGG